MMKAVFTTGENQQLNQTYRKVTSNSNYAFIYLT